MKSFTHITKPIVDQTLLTAPSEGVRLIEPLKSIALAAGMPMKILEEVNAGGDAEVHTVEADLWYCLEGEPVFTVGGTLENARERVSASGEVLTTELIGDSIVGGEEITLLPGEWLWIPAGVPHHHLSTGTTRMVIIKILKFPFEMQLP